MKINEQEDIIALRNNNIIVSASAGSGTTTVCDLEFPTFTVTPFDKPLVISTIK